jgi:ABC-type spermidine/putrescine transport system permease subunit I
VQIVTPQRTSPVVAWLLSAPAVVLFLVLFARPLLLLLRVSVYESSAGGTGFYQPGTWTTHAYGELLGERFGRGIVTFTVALGVAVAALSMLIGYPLALFIHSLPRRVKAVALGAVILPKLANILRLLAGRDSFRLPFDGVTDPAACDPVWRRAVP